MDISRLNRPTETIWILDIDVVNKKIALVNGSNRITVFDGIPTLPKTHNFYEVSYASDIPLKDITSVDVKYVYTTSSIDNILFYVYFNGDLNDFNLSAIYLISPNIGVSNVALSNINNNFNTNKVFVNYKMSDYNKVLLYSLIFDKVNFNVIAPSYQSIELNTSLQNFIYQNWVITTDRDILVDTKGSNTISFKIGMRLCEQLYIPYVGGIYFNGGIINPSTTGLYSGQLINKEAVICSTDHRVLISPIGEIKYGLPLLTIKTTL